MATPETALLQGGYSTVPHKNVREYLKMLAVYGPGAAGLGPGLVAAARVTIQDQLETHFSENGLTFAGYNGMTNYHKEIYADVARMGLIEARSDAIATAFPHADLAEDYAQLALTTGPMARPQRQAMRFFTEMQNQVARGNTAATIRTWLNGLGLPSTGQRVSISDPQLAALTVACVRLYHDANWNGTVDPGNAVLRLTATNIRAYLRSPQYIDDVTLRSWVAESQDIFTFTIFNETLEKLHGDVAGGGELAYTQLSTVWLRHVGTASPEALQWAAFMIGHGYTPDFGMRNFDTELSRGRFTPTENYLYLTLDETDVLNPKLQFRAVIGDAAAKINHATLTVDKLGTFTAGSMTLTPVDLDTLVGLVNLGGGSLQCECTLAVGQLSVGSHLLFELELGPANNRSAVEQGTLTLDVLEDSADTSPGKGGLFSLVHYRLRTELLSSVNASPLTP